MALGDVEARLPVGDPRLRAEHGVVDGIAVHRVGDWAAEPVVVAGAAHGLRRRDDPRLADRAPRPRGAVRRAPHELRHDEPRLRVRGDRPLQDVGGARQELVAGEQPLEPRRVGAVPGGLERRAPVLHALDRVRAAHDLGARRLE